MDGFKVEVIDPVEDYQQYMESIFDFNMIRKFIKGCYGRTPFKMVLDSMNGGKNKITLVFS